MAQVVAACLVDGRQWPVSPLAGLAEQPAGVGGQRAVDLPLLHPAAPLPLPPRLGRTLLAPQPADREAAAAQEGEEEGVEASASSMVSLYYSDCVVLPVFITKPLQKS